MEQVAHQTIVMQFILELAKSLKVDPRGCFRQFFEKIKVKLPGCLAEKMWTKVRKSQFICIFLKQIEKYCKYTLHVYARTILIL